MFMWDFVELPSQLQENWLYESETLNSFAAHYQSGRKNSRWAD
jgi:Zn-dependent oligopeptidase